MQEKNDFTHRVMVIGLDGATLKLIEPWVKSGYLPTLARLMNEGGCSQLTSVQPVVSAAAWATFMTGMNPGNHGVYDFVYRDPESYQLRPVTRLNIDSPSLWHLLSEHGKRVCVLNVPITYPPEKVNGIMVSGLGTPNYATFTYPAEIGKELLQDGYQINRQVYEHRGQEEDFLADTYRITDGVTKSALNLLGKEAWDFFMVVYRDTDELSHGFWHHMDSTHPEHNPLQAEKYGNAIRDYYCYLDQQCADLIAAAGNDATIFVVSDHGFGPFYKDVFLNEWLRQKGYLASKNLSPRRSFSTRLGLTRSNISRILRSTGLGYIERLIKNILGDRIEILPRSAWTDFSDGIDWSKTKAYSFGYQGQIYINQSGREPKGIVSPGLESEALLEELTKELQQLIDPDDGLPVVDAICRGDQLYSGRHKQRGPDLIVTMRNYAYMTRLGHELDNEPGEIFSASRWNESGGHQLDGTLIASGPGIGVQDKTMPSAWIGDIAPTIMHLLQCATDNRLMDGQVLEAWVVDNNTASTDSKTDGIVEQYRETEPNKNLLSEEEEAEVMERLRALGYL